MLQQNRGKQAAILNRLELEHRKHSGSLASLMRDRRGWQALLRAVARTIEVMPLWKLQRVGGTELRFLYQPGGTAHEISLLPGVAFCFRRFQPLIQDLVQGAWERFVRSVPENRSVVGTVYDLGQFLFGCQRSVLVELEPILRELQDGRCFYCGRGLERQAAVDHFVPWARYSLDLGHNFVLTDAECNGRKGDVLAAYDHLERWCLRNEERGIEIAERLDQKGVLHDLDASRQITRWAYRQAEAAAAQVWLKNRQLVQLDARWRLLPGLVT